MLVYLSGCLFVCLCPINVKMAELIGTKCCVTSRDTTEHSWMIKFSKICLQQNLISIKF